MSRLCCPGGAPSFVDSDDSPTSTTARVYEAYDDYFASLPMQPPPPPVPVAWPEPVVLSEDIYELVGRTYVPLTQKMPPPRQLSPGAEAWAAPIKERLDRMRYEVVTRLPMPPARAPVTPERHSSLPAHPRQINLMPMGPIGPPPRPDPKRPLPMPPGPAYAPPNLPGLAPPVAVPSSALLRPEDALKRRPMQPVQGVAGPLRPLMLPQVVAQRGQGLRPLLLPLNSPEQKGAAGPV